MLPVLLLIPEANVEGMERAVSLEVLAEVDEALAEADEMLPQAVPQIILTDWHGGWHVESRHIEGFRRREEARSSWFCAWGIADRGWSQCGPTIHAPAGQAVVLTVQTEQERRLRIPGLGVDVAIVPGVPQPITLAPGEEGDFAILDGAGSDTPVATLALLSPSAFRDWVAPTVCEDPGSGAHCCGPFFSGETVFKKFGCNGCHLDGEGGVGPPLKGLYGREVRLSDGTTVIADVDYIVESILVPGARIVEGYPLLMPTYAGQLDDEQLMMLIEYLVLPARPDVHFAQ